MRRRKQDYKVRELYELNPIRYKSERKKEFNRIIVRDENNTKRARRARRINKIILTLMIIVGITFIIYPTILRYIGERSSQQLMEEFEDNLEDENEEEMDVEEEETKEPSSLSQEDADTLSKEEVIGIIKIEAIDIKYPILEGTSGDVLNKGIGHLSETAGIGEAGNCVLCGHNGSRSGTFFTPLNNVQIGDLVEILDKRGKNRIYKIVKTSVVGPRDNSIKDTDGTEKLTLFTCAEHGTKRFVCECVPVEGENKGKESGK